MTFSLSKLILPGNYIVELTIRDKNAIQPMTSEPIIFFISVVTDLSDEEVKD